MNQNLRKFEFNTIYVLESLEDDEAQTGEILYHDLLKRKAEQIDPLDSRLRKLVTRQDFFAAFEEIKKASADGNYPYVHIEMHGSENGLKLKSGERVTWQEVAHRCQELNIIIKNNLILSLATCFGAYVFKAIVPTEPAPFWGFVGSWEEIYPDDIMVSFYAFFECLLSGEISNIDFVSCIEALNNSNPGLTFRYRFYNCEIIFDKASNDYMQSLNSEFVEKGITNLVGDRLNDLSISMKYTIDEVRQMVEQEVEERKKRAIESMRKRFLIQE